MSMDAVVKGEKIMYSFYLDKAIFDKLCSAAKENSMIENGGQFFAKF